MKTLSQIQYHHIDQAKGTEKFSKKMLNYLLLIFFLNLYFFQVTDAIDFNKQNSLKEIKSSSLFFKIHDFCEASEFPLKKDNEE